MFEEKNKTAEDVANEYMEELKKKKATDAADGAKKDGGQAHQDDSHTPKKESGDDARDENDAGSEDSAEEQVDGVEGDEEQKAKKKKSGFQKRIDELVRQRNEERESYEAKLKALQEKVDKLAEVTGPKPEEVEKKTAEERIQAQLSEDSGKPREQRREMTKDELEEWFIEDSAAATEWMTKRAVRREREAEAARREQETRANTEKLLAAQAPYIEKTIKAHPELDTSKREAELMTEGKSPKEIFEVLCKENKKFDVMQSVLRENPHFYTREDGPVLAVREMERRLGVAEGSTTPAVESSAEREARIRQEAAEAERQRQDSVDASDASSSRQVKTNVAPTSEFEKVQAEIARKAGISTDRLKKRLEIRKGL